MKHDIIYRDNKDIETRHHADREMIKELDSIENPTFRERVERMFVKKALQAKIALGQGISENDSHQTHSGRGSVFTDQKIYAEERHREFRKPKHLLTVKVFHKDDIWSSDIIHMPPERGYKYCLTVIDLYTRFAWVIQMKTKTAKEVKAAFEKIIRESKRFPKRLWTDKDGAFNLVKTIDIQKLIS